MDNVDRSALGDFNSACTVVDDVVPSSRVIPGTCAAPTTATTAVPGPCGNGAGAAEASAELEEAADNDAGVDDSGVTADIDPAPASYTKPPHTQADGISTFRIGKAKSSECR